MDYLLPCIPHTFCLDYLQLHAVSAPAFKAVSKFPEDLTQLVLYVPYTFVPFALETVSKVHLVYLLFSSEYPLSSAVRGMHA